ncbi:MULTISPECIES: trypsin-like serine peptidase [Mycolicibacterium]|nr:MULTISPECIES: trypsin-like peptidase domain-containing protein [Mycolicibacterium]
MRVVRKAMVMAAVAITVTYVASACADAQPRHDGAPPTVPDPRVGALFLGGGSLHTCTAAVLDSTAGDLILTAAHCLVDGVETEFMPGFRDGAEAAWRVTAVYLDPRWLADQDPQADFAIARVVRDGAASVQQQAGGGLSLGAAPSAGATVTVTGYPTGTGGGPRVCRGSTSMSAQGFPSLSCAGLGDGFSGAPWAVGSTVTGIVGGLDGGGCDDDVSYSPRFDDGVVRLLHRAEEAGDGDTIPTVLGSDC